MINGRRRDHGAERGQLEVLPAVCSDSCLLAEWARTLYGAWIACKVLQAMLSLCVCVPTGLCSAGNRCHMSSMHAHLHEQLYSCSSSRPAGSTASGMHDILALQEFEKGTPVKCNPLAWWTFKDCFEYLDRRELAVQASVAAQPHCMHFTRLTCCARCTRMLDEASSDGLLPCYLRHDAEQMQGAAEVARLLMTHSTVMHTWNLPSAPCPYGAGIIKVSHTCA